MSETNRPANWPATWSGKTWQGGRYDDALDPYWVLTEEELWRLYGVLGRPQDDRSAEEIRAQIARTLDVRTCSAPKANRALQLLRQKGLAEHTGQPRRWRRVG